MPVGTLYIVGVGPGDPDLVTLKAAKVLAAAPVWLAPYGKQGGDSTALAIAAAAVGGEGKTVERLYFPMRKVPRCQQVQAEVAAAWRRAAGAVLAHLDAGRDVAFPTLGDPALYSTGFYVCETVTELRPDARVRIIPGVSSIGASAAAAGGPLCLGDDRLVVIPATYENGLLREVLERFDAVVLMKVHRVMDRVLALLDEMELLDQAVLVERTGQEGERIIRGLRHAAGLSPHYFSTIIVRRPCQPEEEEGVPG